jgi:hypothetical protein
MISAAGGGRRSTGSRCLQLAARGGEAAVARVCDACAGVVIDDDDLDVAMNLVAERRERLLHARRTAVGGDDGGNFG